MNTTTQGSGTRNFSDLSPQEQARLRARSSQRAAQLEAMGASIVRRSPSAGLGRVAVREVSGKAQALTPSGYRQVTRVSRNATVANLDELDERQQFSRGDWRVKSREYVDDTFQGFERQTSYRQNLSPYTGTSRDNRWDDDSNTEPVDGGYGRPTQIRSKRFPGRTYSGYVSLRK